LFDQDGISIRFMNSDFMQNNIKTEQQCTQIVDQISFKGLTPMGTSLKVKVLEPMVLAPARARQLQKPVLVITITDGQPAGEPPSAVEHAIRETRDELDRSGQYRGGCSFQFAQVGNDLKAREFLGKLDEDPIVGHLVDCTSNYEVEADEMSRKQPPVNLTPELWLAKLLLGAIDPSYDAKDENQQRPVQGQAQYGTLPPGQYGASQPGQYAPPPGQYPPPGVGYPPQQGYPPQGQYGFPPPSGQGGYPPHQVHPPQGQFGAPHLVGQGGYPLQQGYPPHGQGGYTLQQQGGQSPTKLY